MKKEESFYERIVLILLIIGTGIFYYVACQAKAISLDGGLASMDFPKALLLLLGILCILKLVSNIKNMSAENSSESINSDKRILLTIFAIIIYSALWNVLGYCLSTFLFLNAEAKIINKRVNKTQLVVIAFIGTLITFLVFGVAFKVYLPEPILESFI